ncbi:MAG: hypothetical protein PHW32_03120 [Bacilli bacterium]|nr:hypothetical protein [Bacilli bacterium]MDD4282586.1 hypothetical protein [Bacilli bacterium]MDD4718699.1 hypothetical protein [Bacilli bacterium]
MQKYKKYIVLSLLILVGGTILISGLSFAKYVSNSVWDYYLQSKGFYFSSDYLAEIPLQNVDNLWDGGSVNFNIKNNLNENVITTYDIGYQAECSVVGDLTEDIDCYLNGTESNIQEGVLSSFQTCINNTLDEVDVSLFTKTECELGGYEWIHQIAVKDLHFDVVSQNEEITLEDVLINIKVTSTYPYKKTISGDFILHKRNVEEEKVTINLRNYSNYDRLIISNSYLDNKCVNITWDPDKLVLGNDETDFISYLVDSNNYISGIKLNIDGKESKSYIFYKKDFNAMYNINDFAINEC